MIKSVLENLLMSKKTPILVTAIGGGGHGEQILKALTLSNNDSYYIIGADAQPNCPQFSMTDGNLKLPLANDPSYMDALFSACDKYDIQALFHGCEPELKVFSQNRKKIEDRGIFLPINPSSVIELCMNKEKTNEKLKELDLMPPRYARISSKEDLKEIDWYPVVVKPSVGGGGSANVYIAQDKDELFSLMDYLGLERVSGSYVIQEYVGTPEDEYTVGVLFDMDGNYINSIAVHRYLSGQLNIRTSVPNRTKRSELGRNLVISSGVSHGYVGRFDEVTKQCVDIAQKIGARGAINVQCRFVNGKVKVFEINPRFSGTTSLRAMMGYNEPDILMRKHILGEDINVDFPYEEGEVLRGLIEYKI